MIYKFETDELVEARMMLAAVDLQGALWDLDQWLREQIKYHDQVQLQPARDYLYQVLAERGVDLDLL